MKNYSKFTLQQLAKSKCAALNRHLFKKFKSISIERQIGGRLVTKIYLTKSKEKNAMACVLLEYCQERCFTLYEEYLFTIDRKWRFDWCIPQIKVAIEYEGIFSAKSRHTHVNGYTMDTTKYNRAAQEGWTVLRYTARTYHLLQEQLLNLKSKHV